MKRSSFALPFLCFILMSWLATKWSGETFSGDLAKALYWVGTAPLSCMTLFTIARSVRENETEMQNARKAPGRRYREVAKRPIGRRCFFDFGRAGYS